MYEYDSINATLRPPFCSRSPSAILQWEFLASMTA